MSRWIKGLVVIAAAWVAIGPEASAQDEYAVANGNWNDPATWNTGTVPGSSKNVFIGSTSPGASLATVSLSQDQSASNLTLGNGIGTAGTLGLGSHTLTISNALTIGLNGGLGSITRSTGSITAANVNVESGNTFTFGSGDVTGTLSAFSGSTVTTASTGNVTSNVNVFSGSTLNLGANLGLGGGQLDVENTGSVLNLNGFKATAANVLIGQFTQQPVTVERGVGGSLTAQNLYIAANTLNLASSDSVTNLLNLNTNATMTTASTGNLTGNVEVLTGSTLKLGADLSTNGIVDLQDGGSISANGHAISAINLQLGVFGTTATSVTDAGNVSVQSLFLAHGSTMTMQGGTISSELSLAGGSTLTVEQAGDTGLSMTGASPGLSIDSTSHLHLVFTSTAPGNWDFRWADPSNGNWIGTLQGLIDSGEITITPAPGWTYSLVDRGGYTYVEGVSLAAPEPSSIVLGGLALAGVATAARGRRRRRGRSSVRAPLPDGAAGREVPGRPRAPLGS